MELKKLKSCLDFWGGKNNGMGALCYEPVNAVKSEFEKVTLDKLKSNQTDKLYHQ